MLRRVVAAEPVLAARAEALLAAARRDKAIAARSRRAHALAVIVTKKQLLSKFGGIVTTVLIALS